MISVRLAHIDDADDLAQAHVQGWRVGYRGLFPDDYLDSPEFERQRVERWRLWTWQEFTGSTLFAGLIDDRVMGFAHVGPEREQPSAATPDGTPAWQLPGPVGEVYGFYLHPDAWGSGLATMLMDRAAAQLGDSRHGAAVLWVLRDNPRARAFYEKAGWRPTGLETMWEGPQSANPPPEAVAEVQYATTLRGRGLK